jgi:hypothetical protein
MNNARTSIHTRTSWIAAITLTALLQACGGGGGNDPAKPGAQPSDTATPLTTLSFQTSTVESAGLEGDTSAVMSITATGSKLSTLPVYVQADISGEGLDPRAALSVSGDEATVQLHPAAGLAPGRYTGTATLRLCADGACTRVYPGSPKVVAYTVQVWPLLRSPISSLSMATAESGVASPALLTLLPAGSGLPMSAEVDDGGAGWLSAEAVSNGVFRIRAAAGALHTGFYEGAVKVRTTDGLQSLSVPVSLIVNAGMLVPPVHTTTLNAATVLADTQGQVPVGASLGVRFNWTATSNTPWIQLDGATGAAGGAVRWHLDLNAVDKLANLATHEGLIHLQADNDNVSPVDIRVLIHKRLPEVDVVAPHALPTGQATTVTVTGSGFNAIDDLSIVRVGNVVPSSVRRLSDSTLAVALPALPAGDYKVSLHKLAALGALSHALKVYAPANYAYAAVPTASLLAPPAGLPTLPLYDPVRQTLTFQHTIDDKSYAFYNAQTRLVQFRWNGSQWVPKAVPTPGELLGLGITADGQRLVTTGSRSVAFRDPDTLDLVDGYDVPISLDHGEGRLAITNNNHLLALYDRFANGTGPLSYVDFKKRTVGFHDFSLGTVIDPMAEYGVQLAGVSGDGEHVLIGSTNNRLPLSLDASQGKLRASTFNAESTYDVPVLNRDGSRVWVGLKLHNSTGQLLGTWDPAPLRVNARIVGFHVALDAMRLYALTYAQSVVGDTTEPTLAANAPKPVLKVYDLTRTDAAGKFYPVGEVQLQHYPGCRTDDWTMSATCPAPVRMTSTPDGRTVFMIGVRNLVVATVPALP